MSKVKFLKLKFYLPKKEEQQKIANCLSSIDNNIEEQKNKIKTLEKHKKGLMQGLFVNSEVN
jgi:type I restriction enzyme S subunit